MATIQDVALLAGVSTATVSRAFSAPEVVAPGTRARIDAAVARLGYAPNAAAKILRTNSTRKILVTVPDISNPFFALVIRGVEESAQAAGYSVLLGDTRQDPEREAQYARMLHRKEADGLIFLGHHLPQILSGLAGHSGTRLAIVNGCAFRPELGVSGVGIDNFAAAWTVIDHLYGLGHRRIAVLSGPEGPPPGSERRRGVYRYADQSDEPIEITVWESEYLAESGLEQTLHALSQPNRPTAVFCFNDEMAMGALAAVRHMGLRCPDDVSIVGFDDIRYARMTDPPLTTVRQPMADLGREAVRLLLDIIDGRSGQETSVSLPFELVVRGSTAPPK